MTPRAGQDWDELRLSEDPAVDLLAKYLGYTYVDPDALDAERDSLKERPMAHLNGKQSQL